MMDQNNIRRCGWTLTDPLMTRYHDEEWGVPVHDDKKLFEFMILDAFQAGLSWRTVLHKRENFRRAFDGFDPEKIAGYSDKKYLELLSDAGIIRNRAKIRAAIDNAGFFLKVKDEFGSFASYIWEFVNHKTLHNQWKNLKELPARTEISDRMSKDMSVRGFRFTGSTICYSFMQAAGLVNDHTVDCFRYKQLIELDINH